MGTNPDITPTGHRVPSSFNLEVTWKYQIVRTP